MQNVVKMKGWGESVASVGAPKRLLDHARSGRREVLLQDRRSEQAGGLRGESLDYNEKQTRSNRNRCAV